MASLESVLSGEAFRSLRTSSSNTSLSRSNSTSLISSAMDENEAEGLSSDGGLEGMGLIVLVCCCGKGGGVGETPSAEISRSS